MNLLPIYVGTTVNISQKKVQINNTEITLSLLFLMFIIVMMVTITNYHHHPINYLSILYIYAEPNDDNNEKAEKETKIDKEKEEQEQTKDKDKDKLNSDKNKEKSDTSYIDPAYRSFFPIKRIIIPEVYETIPNGQTYRFNINTPNDKVQVDKTENQTFLHNKILMEVGE